MFVFLFWLGCVVFVLLPILCIIYVGLDDDTTIVKGWVCVFLIFLWFATSITLIKHAVVTILN